MNSPYDAIIIGTGQAGPFLGKRLSDAGMSVAIVERHLFGGTCVNTGCIPTKAMVASAHAAHTARRGADFGVTIDGLSLASSRRPPTFPQITEEWTSTWARAVGSGDVESSGDICRGGSGRCQGAWLDAPERVGMGVAVSPRQTSMAGKRGDVRTAGPDR
jgi:hypothetical protein